MSVTFSLFISWAFRKSVGEVLLTSMLPEIANYSTKLSSSFLLFAVLNSGIFWCSYMDKSRNFVLQSSKWR